MIWPGRALSISSAPEISKLAGRPLVHDSGLRKVMFSRHGNTVLTITDRAAQLWDIQTGEPIAEKIAASDTSWQAIAVSPDARDSDRCQQCLCRNLGYSNREATWRAAGPRQQCLECSIQRGAEQRFSHKASD